MSAGREKLETFPILFWIGLGLFVVYCSHKLGIGTLRSPGPGFMPFLLGCFLSIVSLWFLVGSFRQKEESLALPAEQQGQINLLRLACVLIALFAYSFFFEKLGFLIATLLMLVILFRSMGTGFRTAMIAAAVTAFASYFLFTSIGIRFPKGVLKGL